MWIPHFPETEAGNHRPCIMFMVLQESQREHFLTQSSDPALTDSHMNARFSAHRDDNLFKVNISTLFTSHEFPS